MKASTSRRVLPQAARSGAVAAALILAAVLLLPIAAVAAPESSQGSLVVSGRAELRAVPDMAKFRVGVETRAETVDEAGRLNAEAMESLRTALYAAGAVPDDLKSTNFSVSPEWQYLRDGSRVLLGYRVVHTLEVTVTNLDRLGPMLDAALANGANQVSGPTFGIKNPEELEAQALAGCRERSPGRPESTSRESRTSASTPQFRCRCPRWPTPWPTAWPNAPR